MGRETGLKKLNVDGIIQYNNMGQKTKLLTDVDAGREGWREKIKILTFVDVG